MCVRRSWRLLIGLLTLGGLHYFGLLAACKDTSKRETKASRSRLSTVRFANGPKRSMERLLGAEKNNFFNSRY